MEKGFEELLCGQKLCGDGLAVSWLESSCKLSTTRNLTVKDIVNALVDACYQGQTIGRKGIKPSCSLNAKKVHFENVDVVVKFSPLRA